MRRLILFASMLSAATAAGAADWRVVGTTGNAPTRRPA